MTKNQPTVQAPELARQMLSNPQLEAALLNSLLSNREGIDLAMQRLIDYDLPDVY